MAWIYILTNKINQKTYIGKTEEKTPKERILEHSYKSDKCVLLKKAVNKYGWISFEIECLEVSNKLINMWEKHLIKRWDSKVPSGYNLTNGGEGQNGFRFSEEQKRKLSEAHLGICNWMKGKRNSPQTEFKKGQHYSTLTEFKKNQNMGKNNINSTPIMLIHPDGKEEEFDCQRDACRKYNLDFRSLSAVVKNKRKHHKYFRCKYMEVTNG